MLKFTDAEIEHELLETGYLYDGDTIIEKQAVETIHGHYVGSRYCYSRFEGTCRQPSYYRSLAALLFCERLSFEKLRTWKYHGILMSNAAFQARTKGTGDA
jgi:hypothetical protein